MAFTSSGAWSPREDLGTLCKVMSRKLNKEAALRWKTWGWREIRSNPMNVRLVF